jgi:hypothetical protein
MPQPETVEHETPMQRLERAVDAFNQLNEGVMPPGIANFNLPPNLDVMARLDGLANLLIAKGVITDAEYVEARTLRAAELVEDVIRQAQEAKRQMTGLVIAGSHPPA